MRRACAPLPACACAPSGLAPLRSSVAPVRPAAARAAGGPYGEAAVRACAMRLCLAVPPSPRSRPAACASRERGVGLRVGLEPRGRRAWAAATCGGGADRERGGGGRNLYVSRARCELAS